MITVCTVEIMSSSEIHRLTWTDVDFENRFVVLYTRKKLGGHLTPRKVSMTKRLYDILLSRYQHRTKDKPLVFWQRYWDRKKEEWME
jgi:integrase